VERNSLEIVNRETRQVRNKRVRDWHRDNPQRSYVLAAKKRARIAGLPFNLEDCDIVFPDLCPALGIPIYLEHTDGPRRRTDNTPSLDRLVPDKGYVRGNVRIISWRANRLKNDATLEELKLLVNYVENSS